MATFASSFASSLRVLLPAAALAFASSACVLHLGDDDDAPCALDQPAGAEFGDVALTLLVDPETLACVDFSFGGCGGCGDCPEPLPPIPTWGACQSQCTGLPEGQCGTTSGCRTAYDHACLTGGMCPALTPYIGCFAIDTTGPAAGSCENLGAFECSRHDSCLATYRDNGLCSNGIDDDRDGAVDDFDECRSFGMCLPERIAQ